MLLYLKEYIILNSYLHTSILFLEEKKIMKKSFEKDLDNYDPSEYVDVDDINRLLNQKTVKHTSSTVKKIQLRDCIKELIVRIVKRGVCIFISLKDYLIAELNIMFTKHWMLLKGRLTKLLFIFVLLNRRE